MKFPSPAAAALAGAAQAQFETGASAHGIAFAADLAPLVDPTRTPTDNTLPPWLCFRSAAAAPHRQLPGGDAVGSLN